MDALSILGNALWQDAQRPRHRPARPNMAGELAAFARQVRQVPQLVYSTAAWRWLARGRPIVVPAMRHTGDARKVMDLWRPDRSAS